MTDINGIKNILEDIEKIWLQMLNISMGKNLMERM